MGRSKTTKNPVLTPDQQQASTFITNQIQKGQQAYTGSFDVLPPGFFEEFMNSKDGTIPGMDPEVSAQLKRLALGQEGADTSPIFAALDKSAAVAAKRGSEDAMAAAGAAGSTYSSAARGAAAAAAADVQAQKDLLREQLWLGALKDKQQVQLAGIGMMLEGAKTAQALKLDAARIVTAANQFQKGMEYEEWKRMNPDVYQLAQNLFGRNVDYMVQKKPNMVGPALMAVATIVSGIMTGGATVPAGIAATSAMYNNETQGG